MNSRPALVCELWGHRPEDEVRIRHIFRQPLFGSGYFDREMIFPVKIKNRPGGGSINGKLGKITEDF